MGVDHEAVLRQLRDESGWSGRYAFLIVVSAGICLFGLLTPSVAVVVGAMLLSPLMMPIMGVGFGIATLDFREMRRAGFALGAGSLLAIALSVALVLISPIQTITTEIAARTQPTLFDLIVALLSALAGSYALIRGRGHTVVGVAIATALMPPIVTVGFGVATANWTVFSGALLLFLTNAVTIALSATLVARVYGFGSGLSPHHTGWQLLLFVAALGILAIPLGKALTRIAFDAVAQRQARDTLAATFPDGARISQLDIDPAADPMRVRVVMLTPRIAPDADRRLATDLRRRLGRPVDIHVDQLRISPETGAVEAAQIARAGEAAATSAAQDQDRAVAALALIAGVPPSAVTIDVGSRTLTAQAATLPGLELAGYRALAARAAAATPGWTTRLAPPIDVAPPPLAIDGGVIDTEALDLAGWASAVGGQTLAVEGGLAVQRAAVVRAILARGGQASGGRSDGALRLVWIPAPPPVIAAPALAPAADTR